VTDHYMIMIMMMIQSCLNLGYNVVLPERYNAVHGVLETFRLRYQLLIDALLSATRSSNNDNTHSAGSANNSHETQAKYLRNQKYTNLRTF